MNYRIKKYKKGYVVEVQLKKWHGKKYWTHFISVYGINSMPWYHSSYEYAEMNLLDKIKYETIRNTNDETLRTKTTSRTNRSDEERR